MTKVRYFGSALQSRVAQIQSLEGLAAELIEAENSKKFWISAGVVDIAKFYVAAETDIKDKIKKLIVD